MKAHRVLAAALIAALVCVAGYTAIAQLATPPSVAKINPNADLLQVIPNGVSSPTSVFATPAQLKASGAYYKSVPLTGFRLTMGNTQTDAAFRPAGTLASGYVTFAPSPSDGDRVCLFSTEIITLFYPTANTGQTVNNAVTTLGALGHVCYLYGSANLTWDRVE